MKPVGIKLELQGVDGGEHLRRFPDIAAAKPPKSCDRYCYRKQSYRRLWQIRLGM
jgi:hypothetical protein